MKVQPHIEGKTPPVRRRRPHGDNLGDHPLLDHQLGLWDSLVRVPAILRLPASIAAGTVRRDPASLEDVFVVATGFRGGQAPSSVGH